MDIFEALYTTRAMRRVTSEPIPTEVQASIMDAAIRAPSGGNQQNWRFLLVDDASTKSALAPFYREAMVLLWDHVYKPQLDAAAADPEAPDSIQFLKVQSSAQWLADHFEEVPLYLFPFSQNDTSGGSIYPAVWSAMLAARAHGVGSCLTMVLALHGAEVLEILGVPTDEGWHMAGCVSLGYPTGTWGVAARQPVNEVTFSNRWGTPTTFDASKPLWTPST
ncbi:MAG: nitroreductase family protein [Actinomycetes bacterium]